MATTTLTAGPVAAARKSTRARLILVLLCAAQFAVAIDFSILNIALPNLGHGLGLSEANLQWAITAFALPSGGFLLLAGRLGDLVGRRRMFLAGLGLFAVASLCATLAIGPATFLAARAAQGLGAAATIPTAMALLTTTFAEGPERNRALGVSGMVLSLGFTLGMLLGGTLTSAFGWRSTMALNVVMAVPVFVGAVALLTESRPPRRSRLDLPGAATATGGLLALIYAVSTAAETSWTRPDVLVTLLASALLFGVFVVVESRHAQPLVSLGVLRRRTVAWANLGGLVTFAMASSLTFLLTLYLQQIRHLSPFASGLVFGVTGLGAVSVGAIAPRLVNRYGSRTVLVAGLTVQAAATAVHLATGAHDGVWLVLVFCTVAFGGHMAAIVSYGITATTGLSDREQGLATGLLTTAQQTGLTAGTPILSAVYAAHAAALAAGGASPTAALLGGVHRGVAVNAAVTLAAAALIGVALRPSARR